MASKTAKVKTSDVADPIIILRGIRSHIPKLADALDEAKAKYDLARAHFEEVEKRYLDLREQEHFWIREAGEGPLGNESRPTDPQAAHARTPFVSNRAVPYGDLARHVLEEAGRPLTTNEIVRQLVRKGQIPQHKESDHKIRGVVYSSMARRKKLFSRVDGHWHLIISREIAPDGARSRSPSSGPQPV